MKFRPALVLLFALSTSCALAQSAADLGAGPKPRKAATWPLQPTTVQAQAAQLSARFLTRFHYDAQPLDDAMSARIYKAYFKMLDGDKVFFTQADMDKFAPLKTKLDDAIWNSDLSAPFSIFNLYLQRAVERMTYARGLLKKGFDLTRDESLRRRSQGSVLAEGPGRGRGPVAQAHQERLAAPEAGRQGRCRHPQDAGQALQRLHRPDQAAQQRRCVPDAS